jgi:hypothetical protein
MPTGSATVVRPAALIGETSVGQELHRLERLTSRTAALAGALCHDSGSGDHARIQCFAEPTDQYGVSWLLGGVATGFALRAITYRAGRICCGAQLASLPLCAIAQRRVRTA